MKNVLKRYRAFLIVALALGILTLFNRELGMKAWNVTGFTLTEMLQVLPPIFILLGLLDIWVPRQTMVKYMGEGSGLIGILLAFFIGSAAAGPLYGAFPVAAVFMKKGVKFSNIMIFIGSWSTTKIPMLLFEMTSLGTRFALTRLLIDIPGIILIAVLISRFLTKEEKTAILANAENFDH